MIITALIINNKKVDKIKSNKTEKFTILNICQDFIDKFQKGQYYYVKTYRYGLQYLTRNYGKGHFDRHVFTSGMRRNMLVATIKKYYWSKGNFKGKYNSHSLDKLIETLIICFKIYCDKQQKANKWSSKRIKQYEQTHKCSIKGYGRLTYPHDNDHFKTLTFKVESGTGKIIDNHHIQIPYFGKLTIKQNLSNLKNKKLVELKVQQFRDRYILQVVYKFESKRYVTKSDLKYTVGLDINSKDNKILALSDGTVYTLPKEIEQKYKQLDQSDRQLQKQISQLIKSHRKGKEYQKLLFKQTNIENKKAQIVDNWEQKVAKELASKYPVLAMERLQSNGITIPKYKKGIIPKIRKNINHKWNYVIRPFVFRQHIEDAYRNAGGILIEIDPSYTSKTCNLCGTIYEDLGLQKKWYCPNPLCPYNRVPHDRDLNAAMNIRDWALDITKHIVLRKHIQKPWITYQDMFTII